MFLIFFCRSFFLGVYFFFVSWRFLSLFFLYAKTRTQHHILLYDISFRFISFRFIFFWSFICHSHSRLCLTDCVVSYHVCFSSFHISFQILISFARDLFSVFFHSFFLSSHFINYIHISQPPKTHLYFIFIYIDSKLKRQRFSIRAHSGAIWVCVCECECVQYAISPRV